MAKELMTTKEVAEMLGVGTTSIKRWADEEQLDYVLTPGGHRRFLASSVRMHLSQNTRKQFSDETLSLWLKAMLPYPNHYQLEALFFSSRDELNSWWEVAHLIGEVLVQIGNKWAQGDISVLQERLACETLDRLLIKITDSMYNDHQSPTAVLALADGEEHFLGLRLVELCLNSAGWKTIWAGLKTPTHELDLLIESQKYQLLIITASSYYNNQNKLKRLAKRMTKLCTQHDLPLILGGSAPWPDLSPTNSDCQIMRNFHQLQNYLVNITFPKKN